MEFFQIRYFLEVARQQHVRRSAETLNVSQPAVTNAIHRLEAELGVPLFVPSGRSIRLSPYGQFLYEELLPLSETMETLPGRIRSMRTKERVKIRLNVLAAWFIVMEAVVEFQRLDTDASFIVTRSETQEIADISVVSRHHYKSKKSTDDDIYVCPEEILLAVPDTPRFRRGDGIRLQDVADMGFAMVSENVYFRTICDDFCKAAGMMPNTVFESDSPDAVRSMICSTAGLGFWPEFSMGDEGTDRILLKHIEKPDCIRNIIVTNHKLDSDNVHVQVFYEYLTRYLDMYRTGHLRRMSRQAQVPPLPGSLT